MRPFTEFTLSEILRSLSFPQNDKRRVQDAKKDRVTFGDFLRGCHSWQFTVNGYDLTLDSPP